MSVFISYRRADGTKVANEIYNALQEKYDIFLDTESLTNGIFSTEIKNKIENCSDFIILITETTFNRCNEPDDWILNESRLALLENKNIIPIFIGIKGFPNNVPDCLKTLCTYNGFTWVGGDLSVDKLQKFLISNQRLCLSVVREEQSARLSQKSKHDLIQLYKKFKINENQNIVERNVDIELIIDDENDFSNLYIDTYLEQDFSESKAKELAIQEHRRRYLNCKRLLELAIEQMLLDRLIDSCARDRRDEYIKKYGVNQCFIAYEDGIEDLCLTPFAWINVIEELLKELIFNRLNYYSNSKDHQKIEFIAKKNITKEKIWSFYSFIDVNAIKNNPYLIETLVKECGDYFDIPKNDLLDHSYPDFFYELARVKNGLERISFEELSKYNGIFSLTKYYVGG